MLVSQARLIDYGQRDYGIEPVVWGDAWRGCLGNEPEPGMFVAHLVEVAREIRRVLRDDGLFFINLGDKYVSKNLIGIPWLVSQALLDDGWYRRSAMPWVKADPMPESVRTRCTTAHEYIFQFAKSEKYFYDLEAVKVASTDQTGRAADFARATKDHLIPNQSAQQHRIDRKPTTDNGTRNRRTSDTFRESLDIRIADQYAYLAHLEHVRDNGGMMLSEDGDPVAMLVNTANFGGAHFATFPTDLVHPLIACSTSEKGCCRKCGAQFGRVVERGFTDHTGKTKTAYKTGMAANRLALLRQAARENGGEYANDTTTLGWAPTCTCNAGESVPCTVLDPFCGAGTTALEADRMGRNAVGIDISRVYAEMTRDRVAGDAPMFADVEIVENA